MTDDDEVLRHLRADASAEAPEVREAFVNERFAPIRYLFEEARGRVLARADSEHGAELAEWAEEVMKRFEASGKCPFPTPERFRVAREASLSLCRISAAQHVGEA